MSVFWAFYAAWLALVIGWAWTWAREHRELRAMRTLHVEFEELVDQARELAIQARWRAEHCPGCQCNPNADIEGPCG